MQTMPVQTLIDFRDATALESIDLGAGVTIEPTVDGLLEVRVAPFSEHGNHWPLIAFGPRFFGRQINLAHASTLRTVLHHHSAGMSRVDLQVATSPDMTRGVDNHGLLVPGHTRFPVRMPIERIRRNDPSDIAAIQFIFRPREIEMVFLIEPLQLVHDPAVGSPADDLLEAARSLEDAVSAVEGAAVVGGMPGASTDPRQVAVAELAERAAALSADIGEAFSRQFYRTLRSLSQRLDTVVAELGRLRFWNAGQLWLWQPDRYPNVVQRTGPDLDAEPLERLEVSMAGNEFRDCVVMVQAAQLDLSLDITLHPVGDVPLPAAAVAIRRTAYLKGAQRATSEATGDALLPVEGALSLPAGESRQLWIRFDTRTTRLGAGHYPFELHICDHARKLERRRPGELIVWDFDLPSCDVLPNNSYAILGGPLGEGETCRQAVQHMKLYGLNHLYIEPPVLLRPTGLDDDWRITGYDDQVLLDRVTGALEAWHAAPGDDALCFLFSLSGFCELGLEREGYAFPNERWEQVFAQWLGHFKSLLRQAGLGQDRWMLVLADESGEPTLMDLEIPWAEAIKRIDPSVRITCNASTVLSDTDWSTRFFAAFDVFQPNLGFDGVREWLRGSGKPLWVYQCETDLPEMGHDLYGYYRVYAWQMLERGYVGTGLWTYYSAAHDRPWDEDFQGCQLIYLHPDHGVVHARRYEMVREGLDDVRYVAALRAAAAAHGPQAQRDAQSLIEAAVVDITTHRQDHTRCEAWRQRIAARILSLRQGRTT